VGREVILVLLAGGLLDNKPKCLIETPENKTIIEKCLEISRNINYQSYNLLLKKIIICFPAQFELKMQLLDNEEIIPSGSTLTETIENTIQHLSSYDPNIYIIFLATDLPLINFEAVDDIIKRFSLLDGDLFFPIVSKEVYQVRFGKNSRRTFLKMKKDSFCSTGITIIKKETLGKIFPKVKDIIEHRKDPFYIIKSLNLDTLTIMRLLIGAVSVLEAEKIVERIFNMKAHCLLTNYVTLAFNIDNEKDLEEYYKITTLAQNVS